MKLSGLLLALAAGVAATPAWGEEQCGASVTHRYEETRATFGDMLAGCDKAGACYVSTSKVDKTLPANFSQQLRFLQPVGGGMLGMRLTAVQPMADLSESMNIVYGATVVDLAGAVETRDNVVNDYHVKDAAKADAMAREMAAKSRQVRWTYNSQMGGLVIVDLSLRGATKALEWTACMAKPH